MDAMNCLMGSLWQVTLTRTVLYSLKISAENRSIHVS